MLVKVNCSSAKKNWVWTTGADYSYGIVLNTAYMSDIKANADNSSYCDFKYATRNLDRKDWPDPIVVESTLATIQTACESSLVTDLMYLPVYEDDDTDSTPVVHYIRYERFSFARPDPSSPDARAYVYFMDSSFRLNRYLVALTIDELVDYAGSTSTTLHATYA